MYIKTKTLDNNFCKLKFLKKLANLHLEIVFLIFIVCTIRIGTIIEQEHNICFYKKFYFEANLFGALSIKK